MEKFISTDEPVAYINNSVVHIKRENAHKGTLGVQAVIEACNILSLPIININAVNGRGVDIWVQFPYGEIIGFEVKNTRSNFNMSHFWFERNIHQRYLHDELQGRCYSRKGLIITQYRPRSNQVSRAMRGVVLVQTGVQVVDDRTHNRAVRTLMHQLKNLTILHLAVQPATAPENDVFTDACPYSSIDEIELDMWRPIYSDLFSD
jgi:hypothetical protein